MFQLNLVLLRFVCKLRWTGSVLARNNVLVIIDSATDGHGEDTWNTAELWGKETNSAGALFQTPILTYTSFTNREKQVGRLRNRNVNVPQHLMGTASVQLKTEERERSYL